MDHAIIFKGTRGSSSAILTSYHRLARAHREHTAAHHPVRQDGANPTRAGSSLALDSEIPTRLFCRANSSHRLCRMLRSPVASRFFANILFAFEATRWRFSYRLSIRLRRMIQGFFSHSSLSEVLCALWIFPVSFIL